MLKAYYLKSAPSSLRIVIFDDSPKILCEQSFDWLKLPNVTVVETEINVGPYLANMLVNFHCKFDTVVHFDQDDFFTGKNCLEELYRYFERNEFPIAFCRSTGPRGSVITSDTGTLRDIVSQTISVPHSGSMYRRCTVLSFCQNFIGQKWIDMDKYAFVLDKSRFGICESAEVHISLTPESLSNSSLHYQNDILLRILYNRLRLRILSIDTLVVFLALIKIQIRRLL